MGRKELKVVGISNSQTQTGAFALILGEIGSNQRIPIIIGAYEAQSIALFLENIKPSRPLTHDLFVTFFKTLDVQLKEVYINKFSEGIFYSLLICIKDGKVIEIDSRTSDAIALAVRLNAPIYCDEEIIKKTAIVIDEEVEIDIETEDDDNDEDTTEVNLEELTTLELQTILDEAVEKEDFETASIIRDVLNKRLKG